jgi:hypothetical protein
MDHADENLPKVKRYEAIAGRLARHPAANS